MTSQSFARAVFVATSLAALLASARARADEPVATPAPLASSADAPPRPPPPSARDASPLVAAVYEKGFPFCKDESYPLTSEEVAWCDLLPKDWKKDDPRCPRLAALCAKGPQAQLIGRQRHRTSSSFSFDGPHIPSFVVWILLGGALVFVLVRLLGQSVALGAKADASAPEADEPPDVAAAREAARRVETDVERLLSRARTAAAAGDYERGVADAYAALLRKLEGQGLVRVEANRTNGDHLREVARKLPAAEADMRPIVRAVERAQFGGGATDEPSFRFVLDGVVRMLGERLAALVPVVFALGLLAAVAGCGFDREAWDDSPSGQAGVLELLRKYGFEARERLAPFAKLEPDAAVDLLVLMPEVEVGKDDWPKLEAWVSRGGTLVVAGAARALPDWIPVKPSAAGSLVSAPLEVSPRLPPWFTGKTALVPPGPTLEITRAAEPPATSDVKPTDAAPAAAPDDSGKGQGDKDDKDAKDDQDDDAAPGMWPLLERAHRPYAAEGPHGDGRVVVLADEGLFTNVALLVPDDGALLCDLLRRDGQRLELASDLTGLVSPNPLASVSRGKLAPALAQLALVVVLFFACRGTHFGRPRDPIVSRRRAFAEHARALGLQYARGRAARHALWLYGAYALERLRERLHLAGGKGLSSVAEAVATRTGRPLGDVMRVLLEARPDVDAPAPVKPGMMLSPSARDAARDEAAAVDLVRFREIATLLSQTGGAGERSRVQGQG